MDVGWNIAMQPLFAMEVYCRSLLLVHILRNSIEALQISLEISGTLEKARDQMLLINVLFGASLFIWTHAESSILQ